MADDDAVGYRRPPKGSQFGQPGGNRRGPGRRKGARNMATIFAATAGAIIEPKVEGRTRKMSKLEAAMTQLANKAASGDLRAINMLIPIALGLEARAEQDATPGVVLTDADRKLIRMMAERVNAQLKDSGDD